ncbi:MAG: hypothetical protein ACC645_20660, partial [Pirellulales bacterium]
MADKKKMSVVEILAAARKIDGQNGAEGQEEPAESTSHEQTTHEQTTHEQIGPKKQSEEFNSETPATASKSGPVAKPGSPDRPSVADILALARSSKSSGEKPAVQAKPKVQKPAVKSKPAEKSAAKGGASGKA